VTPLAVVKRTACAQTGCASTAGAATRAQIPRAPLCGSTIRNVRRDVSARRSSPDTAGRRVTAPLASVLKEVARTAGRVRRVTSALVPRGSGGLQAVNKFAAAWTTPAATLKLAGAI